MADPLPTASCTSCGREAPCLRMADGTVYKPTAWEYPDDANPLQGICGECQKERAAQEDLAGALFVGFSAVADVALPRGVSEKAFVRIARFAFQKAAGADDAAPRAGDVIAVESEVIA